VASETERGQGQRLASRKIKLGAVARADDGLAVEFALGEWAVVVGATVLDGVDIAVADANNADLLASTSTILRWPGGIP